MAERTFRFITEEVSECKRWREDRTEYWALKSTPKNWETMTVQEKYNFVYENGEWLKDYGGGYKYPVDDEDPTFEQRYSEEFQNGDQTHTAHEVEEVL